MKFSILSLILTLLLSLPLFAQDENAQEADTTAGKAERTLVVGVKQTPPFIIKTDEGYKGVSIDLWEELALDLRLKFRYKEYDLTGLISALEKGEVDLSVNPLTVTPERVRKFDFTQPFYISNLAIATNKEGNNEAWAFIRNFFSWNFFKVVLLLFLVILIFGVLAWFFERRGNPEEFGGKGIMGIWQGIWWSAVTMTTVGYGDKSPRTTGGRIVALVWMFTAVIIISGFTASIASSLTVNRLESNIKGIEDLRKVDVGTIKGSTSEIFLGEQDVETTAYSDPTSGLQAIADGEIDAFVYDEPVMQYIIKDHNLRGDVQILPYKFNKQYYGLSLPKNAKLAERINPVMLEKIKSEEWSVILERYNLKEE